MFELTFTVKYLYTINNWKLIFVVYSFFSSYLCVHAKSKYINKKRMYVYILTQVCMHVYHYWL